MSAFLLMQLSHTVHDFYENIQLSLGLNILKFFDFETKIILQLFLSNKRCDTAWNVVLRHKNKEEE